MVNLVMYILIPTFILGASIKDENPDILHIRKKYKEVKSQINLCYDTEEEVEGCPLYSNQHIVNAHGNSWRAVGEYKKTTTFWYTDDPDFAEAEEMEPESVLKFITVNYESTYNLYEEYLFEDGVLIFYYYHFGYGEEDVEEHRFYFKNEKLIRYLMKGEPETPAYTKEKAGDVLDQAEEQIEVFLRTF